MVSSLYRNIIGGEYDCVARILLQYVRLKEMGRHGRQAAGKQHLLRGINLSVIMIFHCVLFGLI